GGGWVGPGKAAGRSSGLARGGPHLQQRWREAGRYDAEDLREHGSRSEGQRRGHRRHDIRGWTRAQFTRPRGGGLVRRRRDEVETGATRRRLDGGRGGGPAGGGPWNTKQIGREQAG